MMFNFGVEFTFSSNWSHASITLFLNILVPLACTTTSSPSTAISRSIGTVETNIDSVKLLLWADSSHNIIPLGSYMMDKVAYTLHKMYFKYNFKLWCDFVTRYGEFFY